MKMGQWSRLMTEKERLYYRKLSDVEKLDISVSTDPIERLKSYMKKKWWQIWKN